MLTVIQNVFRGRSRSYFSVYEFESVIEEVSLVYDELVYHRDGMSTFTQEKRVSIGYIENFTHYQSIHVHIFISGHAV